MWAMIVKEFRQLRRDRRTLALMIVMPGILLVVLRYAASFDAKTNSVAVSRPQASAASTLLRSPFKVIATRPGQRRVWAQDQLRDGKAEVALVTGGARPVVLIDGSQLFAARAALTALAGLEHGSGTGGTTAGGLAAAPKVTILYNPGLTTSDIMIPGLC